MIKNTERVIKIPKNLGSLTEDEESIGLDKEDEGPEDSFEMLQKTERAFKLGDNQSTSNYGLSPKEILDEYQEFN